MTDQSTTERIAELKKLAEAATPGPRKLERISGYHNVGIRVTGSLVSGYAAFLNTRWPHEGQRLEQEANARLIAATDPQTILSLIERIAELERKNAELAGALQQVWNAIPYVAHATPTAERRKEIALMQENVRKALTHQKEDKA